MTTQTNTIQESKSTTKGADYLNFAKSLLDKANELNAKENEQLFVRNAFNELVGAYRNCEQANCEYTMYVECGRVEGWFKFITDRI